MLKKTGTTPKSHAENIKNIDGTLYFCSDCDRVIRQWMHLPDKCPFCEGVNIAECEIKILKTSESDVKSQDKHS